MGGNPPRLYEANAWASFYAGDFETCRSEAHCWFIDQPFASAPATLASYIACGVFWDFEEGKAIAQASLRSNPEDPFLLNNLAVCQMELGDLTGAEQTLSKLKPESPGVRVDIARRATAGMLEFRKQNPEPGRRLYQEAIKLASQSGEKVAAARATYHLVYEELLSHQWEQASGVLGLLQEFDDVKEFVEKGRFFQRVLELLQKEKSRTNS